MSAVSADHGTLTVLRFVAVSCGVDDQSAAQQEEICRQIAQRSPGLKCHGEWRGLRVFAEDHGTRVKDSVQNISAQQPNGPILIGRAFRRGDHTNCLRTGQLGLNGGSGYRFSSSRQFTRDFWGDYVLFNQTGDGIEVTRDAKGAIPCFYLKLDQCIIWFSDIADLPLSLTSSLRVEPGIFGLIFLFPKMAKSKTGLRGIDQLLPGYSCLASKDTVTASLNWCPASIAAEPYPDLQTAVQKVRESAIEVVSAYLNYYEKPVISVGGLDSSIIWCIAHSLTSHRPQGISLYSDAGRGDERHYVSELPNYERMSEVRMFGGNIDADLLFSPRPMVSPPGFVDLIDLAWDQSLSAIAPSCDAMMYGIGGDNIFLQAAGIYPALDYVNTYGFRQAALRHVADSARYEQTSVLRVIGQCLRQSLRKGDNWSHHVSLFQGAIDRSGLADGYLRETLDLSELHPCYQNIRDLAPGKALQILTSCFYASDFYDPYCATGIERCETFLSQPVVEACLRTPSWFLAYKGIDRGLARLAFADVLPRRVLQRTSKGTPEDVYDEFYSLNHMRMRKFLDDGALMHHGVISKSSLRSTLDGDLAQDKRRSHQIISLVSYEAWARQWS